MESISQEREGRKSGRTWVKSQNTWHMPHCPISLQFQQIKFLRNLKTFPMCGQVELEFLSSRGQFFPEANLNELPTAKIRTT